MGGRLDLGVDPTGCWQAFLTWRISGTKVFLVIDDNRAFVELLRRYLAGDDWYVVGAASGAEARRLLQELVPTIILVDVMMPHEDGWELLRVFKNSTATRDIPIIVCSVLNEPELAAMLGAAAYLVKPVSRDALLQVLDSWRRFVPSPATAR
jgi:CheY-like chemotaxis protein